jgi:hypothetical protein
MEHSSQTMATIKELAKPTTAIAIRMPDGVTYIGEVVRVSDLRLHGKTLGAEEGDAAVEWSLLWMDVLRSTIQIAANCFSLKAMSPERTSDNHLATAIMGLPQHRENILLKERISISAPMEEVLHDLKAWYDKALHYPEELGIFVGLAVALNPNLNKLTKMAFDTKINNLIHDLGSTEFWGPKKAFEVQRESVLRLRLMFPLTCTPDRIATLQNVGTTQEVRLDETSTTVLHVLIDQYDHAIHLLFLCAIRCLPGDTRNVLSQFAAKAKQEETLARSRRSTYVDYKTIFQELKEAHLVTIDGKRKDESNPILKRDRDDRDNTNDDRREGRWVQKGYHRDSGRGGRGGRGGERGGRGDRGGKRGR